MKNVEKEVKVITEICNEKLEHQPITISEVEKAVYSLNKNKASDYYGIVAENIIYGGKLRLEHLVKILNKTFESTNIPDELKI